MSRMKILIVDDEEDVRIFLQYNLHREGYIVVTAPDGKSAIAEASAMPFDLIITDVMMPELNGIAMVRQLQASGINIPVIFLTASNDELHYISANMTGCREYLTKPISLKVLIEKVAAVLKIPGEPVLHGKNNGTGHTGK